MNSALSLGLIGCLMISTTPPVAEETAPVAMQASITQGAIVNAMARQAIRLDAEQPLRPQRSPHLAPASRRVVAGALIGFGVGAALGMTVGQEACLHEPRWHCAKVGIPLGAIGGVVAWLHK